MRDQILKADGSVKVKSTIKILYQPSHKGDTMPLPGSKQSDNQQASPKQSINQGISLNKEKIVFERAPEGQQPAVLAEITQIQVEEDEKDRKGNFTGKKRMVDKILLSFELAATYQDPKNDYYGKRIIQTKDFYPGFSNPKQGLVKMCLTWANKKSFTDAEMAEWASYLEAPMFFPDGSRNPASLVGSPCTLLIVHGTSKIGRDYAAIETVMSPGPGYENLKISDDYTPYAERMANAERRRQERQSKEQEQGKPRQKDEFKGQF